MIDDQALFAIVVDVVGVAVAVVLFLLPLVGDRDPLEDRLAALLQPVLAVRPGRLQVFLSEPLGEVLQGGLSGSQVHLVFAGQGADVWQVQGLIQEATEGRLGVPGVACLPPGRKVTGNFHSGCASTHCWSKS